jgi:hypothetical protein
VMPQRIKRWRDDKLGVMIGSRAVR